MAKRTTKRKTPAGEGTVTLSPRGRKLVAELKGIAGERRVVPLKEIVRSPYWVEEDLCSRCAAHGGNADEDRHGTTADGGLPRQKRRSAR